MKIKIKLTGKYKKDNILFTAPVRIFKKILRPLSQIASFIVNPFAKWLRPPFRIIKRKFKRIVNRLSRRQIKWLGYGFGGLLVIALAIGSFIHVRGLIASSYRLPVNEQALIGQPDKSLLPQLTYDAKAHAYYLNKSAINATAKKPSVPGVPSTAASVTVGADPDNKTQFSLKLPTNANLGITTYDNSSNLSFTMIPLFSTLAGKQVSGHIEYPMGLDGTKAVYTIKANGVQEDIIYASAPKGSVKLRYKLEIPSTLQARMMPGGDLGIYSASPYLFGNITYGTAADEQKVQMARQNSPKDNLVFVLPAPQVITADGRMSVNNRRHIKLALARNIVTVTASGLGNLYGPVSIDPSIVVASASNFMVTGNNEGDITYNTSANQIEESVLSGGTIGTTWTAQTVLPQYEYGESVVAYNGYIYVLGGSDSAVNGSCPAGNNTCVYYDSIGSTGALGASWSTTTSFTGGTTMPGRYAFGTVVYDGYIYVMGGSGAASIGDCNAQSYCSGVFYDSILSTGGLGSSWTSTTALTTARAYFGAVAYDGVLYYLGGYTGASAGDCTAGTGSTYYCGGVYYDSFLANGALGSSWTATTSFSGASTMPARYGLQAVAYNGYMYVLGGVAYASGGDCTSTGDFCNGVFYDSISPTGPLGGAWTATVSFTTTAMPARANFTAAAFNGYLYVTGGMSPGGTGDCTTARTLYYTCSGVFYDSFDSDGTISAAWNTTTSYTGGSTMPARYNLGFVIYQGSSTYDTPNVYMYVVGGEGTNSSPTSADCPASASDYCDGVFSAQINSEAVVGSSWTSTTVFTTTAMPARYHFGTVAYNGYIYVLGGQASAATGDCTYTSDMCNGVFYDNITSSGALGASWTAQTAAYFPVATMPARAGLSVVAYNGYMYVLGGIASGTTTGTDCTAALDYCNGVFYDNITTTGALGTTWTATTVFTATSMPARQLFGAVAYDYNMIVLGGLASASTGDCTAALDFCQGVFDTTINPTTGALGSAWYANATLSSWSNAGMPARDQFGVEISDGDIYVIGGQASTSTSWDCNNASFVCYGVWSAWLCEEGSYGGACTNGITGYWDETNNNWSSFPIYGLGAAVWNGSIYMLGGISNSTANGCTATSDYCNSVWYMQDSDINGTGKNQTTSFTATTMPARAGLGAVAYNGYLYVLGGQASGTTTGSDCTATSDMCNGVFYTPINNGGPGTVSSTWTSTTPFTTTTMPARGSFGSVAYNGYIYVLSGVGAASTGDCTAFGGFCLGVFYALICTGYNSVSGCTTSSVPGTIGTWTSDSAAYFSGASTMPAREDFSTVAYNGNMYVMGGWAAASGGDCTDTPYFICNGVWVDSISSTGALGSGGWTETTTLPNDTAAFGAVAYNGYMYVMGGLSSNITSFSNVYYVPINSTGTITASWQSTTSFNTTYMKARYGFSVVVYNSFLYVIGGSAVGEDCSTDCSGVWYNQICNANNIAGYAGACYGLTAGAIGTTWYPTNALPNLLIYSSAVAYNGYLYVMGGSSNISSGTCNAGSSSPYACTGVFYAPITNSGQIGTWNSTTSFTGASTMPARYGFGAVAYNGYLYVLGGIATVSGGDCTTGCKGVFVTGLHSIPRVGFYSDLIDFTGLSGNDPTPIETVINGGDCVISLIGGCTALYENPGLGGLSGPGGVIIKYKFASNTCTTFNGATTLPTGLSLIGTKQPLVFTTNGCSAATNIGRYMWVGFWLDDSQTTTFPDGFDGEFNDLGNRTAINNFTVYYHSAAGYRLRGGATFSNSALNSLDAPP